MQAIPPRQCQACWALQAYHAGLIRTLLTQSENLTAAPYTATVVNIVQVNMLWAAAMIISTGNASHQYCLLLPIRQARRGSNTNCADVCFS